MLRLAVVVRPVDRKRRLVRILVVLPVQDRLGLGHRVGRNVVVAQELHVLLADCGLVGVRNGLMVAIDGIDMESEWRGDGHAVRQLEAEHLDLEGNHRPQDVARRRIRLHGEFSAIDALGRALRRLDAHPERRALAGLRRPKRRVLRRQGVRPPAARAHLVGGDGDVQIVFAEDCHPVGGDCGGIRPFRRKRPRDRHAHVRQVARRIEDELHGFGLVRRRLDAERVGLCRRRHAVAEDLASGTCAPHRQRVRRAGQLRTEDIQPIVVGLRLQEHLARLLLDEARRADETRGSTVEMSGEAHHHDLHAAFFRTLHAQAQL